MNEIVSQIKKPTSVICLVIIAIISLSLKLYLIDFTIPVTSDNLDYLLMSVSYLNGDFSQSVHRAAGWPMFVSLFYNFLDGENIDNYSNTIRILSIGVSTLTIPLVFIISRKFFDHRYSLVCASLFAFEPHLNHNSGFGLSEPIFLMVVLTSFLFILNKNSKIIIPSLIFAGFAWWVKIDGFFIFFIITVIYFVTHKGKTNLKRNYLFGFVIFLILISPMLIQKQEQFGDPFYSYYSNVMFAGNYEQLLAENTKSANASAYDYIEKNGIQSFIDNFILKGFYNIFLLLSKLSYPYLFILIPFGIIFSFRAFDQNSEYIKSNWIFILLASASMILTLSIVAERRYLLYLIPFFIFFSTIPIQRVTEYGLNTFSFSRKQKDIFLIIVVSIALVLSIYFVTNVHEKPDVILEKEKLRLSNYIVTNLDGNITRDFNSYSEYLNYQILISSTKNFGEYNVTNGINEFKTSDKKLDSIFITGNSLKELISNGKQYDLKYLIAYENDNVFHEFLDDLYVNENKYPYLTMIFDSNAEDFEKIKVKIFKINYNKLD